MRSWEMGMHPEAAGELASEVSKLFLWDPDTSSLELRGPQLITHWHMPVCGHLFSSI